MTRFAITDIHGGNLTFQALLRKIDFRRQDSLFLLGDYVDRGPDSMGVLETICCLKEAGYDVRPIRGNHDEMLLRTIMNDHDEYSEEYFDVWGRDTLESINVDVSGRPLSKYELFQANDPQVQMLFPARYLDLLESMPYILIEPDFVFVHAGLNMSFHDPVNDSDPIEMLWCASGNEDKRKLGGRQLVVGHIITNLNTIRKSVNSDCICLDNGAFTQAHPEKGNLVALNLDTKELIIQPWCDGEAYD
ncbi:MAG: metallophosphoesterase [Desulfuromonadaceae bacterium]